MKEGHIFTEGEIGADYPDLIAAQLARIGEVDKIIHHVSSPGGNVIAGYKGYHKLIELGKPIDTIVEGEAQSMGSFVMMASNATGGKIKILNPSRVMIHNPKFNVQGLTTSGFADSDSLESGAKELRIIEDEMAQVYLNSVMKRGKGTTIDEIKAMMKKETYMSASDAVTLGFADEVINYVPKQENEKLKAVALGLKGGNTMEKKETVMQKVASLLKSAASALEGGVAAVDLPLKEGGMISIEGEAATVGANATIDGKPAEGAYMLEDGQTIKCVGGKITEIMPAAPPAPMPPQETDAQKAERLAKELEATKAQLAQKAEADKAAQIAEQAKIVEAQKAEAEQARAALAKATEELEKLKKAPFGDASKQNEGMEANRTAFAMGGRTTADQMKIKASRTFIAEHLPWLERHYPNGKFSDGTYFRDYRQGGAEAVSILETNLPYTWNGILSTDLFFKPTLDTPAISDVFTVDLGASDSKRYHIAPVFNKVLKPYTGCDQPVTGSSYDITSKKIQLKPFEMYEGWCKDDFTNQLSGSYNVLAQEWLKTGTNSFDPAGTPIDRMIVDGLKDALRRDIWRRISFGSTASSSADYNQINGLWRDLIDQSGASNYCVYASKTNFGTGALSASAAYNELLAIYKNSSQLLKQQAIDGRKGRFLVTRSVWENLYDTYTGTGAVTELAFKQAMDGISGQLTFRGIPVIPISIWDDFLTDSSNPLFATTRHLIAFTLKENHILGVENTSDLEKIDSWFEKKDNKRYYRANMIMGFLGAIHCDLTTISY